MIIPFYDGVNHYSAVTRVDGCNELKRTNRYGGAVGLVGFDGHLNTGLTLRTVRVKDGIAEVKKTTRICDACTCC